MKKLISTVLMLACLALCVSACTNGDGDGTLSGDGALNNTPNPTLSANPTQEPSEMPIETEIGNIGDAIEDFVEGTIVDIASVPEIAKAITDKYEDATITGISHAMHSNEQVYEVRFTDADGATNTAYVSPDGKTVTEAVQPESSATPEATN